MNFKISFTALVILTTFNATAYEQYSVFQDNMDINTVLSNVERLTQVRKNVAGNISVAGTYRYDHNGRVTQRDYADSRFDYVYNSDGLLITASALMKHGVINSYVRHTKINFISEYTYNDQGKVIRENKQVFNGLTSSLDSVPISTYRIKYIYDERGMLIKRTQITKSGDDLGNLEFHYTYHNDGKLRKIQEIKKIRPREKSTLLFQYHNNGEIKKATQTIFGKGTKTIEMEYIDDGSLIYGVYYADPVKEWKVDMDFFGLSFYPIKKLTQTVEDQVTYYKYLYKNNDGDLLPDSLTLELTLPTGVIYDLNYIMENK
ncbi:hypothetical protein [Shewanella sp. YLB-07]|uniref:hypothetical protein n=1 Tax=Shewanella sp. YLB-07 TaxID=2601268 RepID=UPI00128CA0AF|nr:hypothetical protein [Shewanella sp. YLB-07]MPY22801.1 hypothetical protein [Shewanella sp. YLB-07]